MIKYKVIAMILLIPALILRFIITMVISWVKDKYENFDNNFKKIALKKEINEMNQKLYIKILARVSRAGIIIASSYCIYIIASKYYGVMQ